MSVLLRFKPLYLLRLSIISQQLQSRTICASSTCFALLPQRNRAISSQKEESLRLKDDVPADYEIIYRAPMENYVSIAKNASTVTTTLIGILLTYKLASDLAFIDMPQEVDWAGLVAHENDIWIFAAGFLAINLAIRIFVAKFPLRIYKNVDKYLAVYDSQLPFRSTKHFFRKGEVSAVKNHMLNPWNGSFYRLGQRTSLLLVSYFRTPSEFHQLFGLK